MSTTGLFARYGGRYVSASHAFAAHTINSIPATTVAMVYSCATSLVSSELINIKRIEEKKTALSIKIEDMMLELQVCMGVPLRFQQQRDVCWAFNIMDKLTEGKKVPRLFQMRTALEIIAGKNIVVRAGTGSGKTIAMALAMLLRTQWIFVTLAPLLALQEQHVSL